MNKNFLSRKTKGKKHLANKFRSTTQLICMYQRKINYSFRIFDKRIFNFEVPMLYIFCLKIDFDQLVL